MVEEEVVEKEIEKTSLEEKIEETLNFTGDEPIPGDKERKEAASLVVIGHVDSGKSTLCGQLLFLTGNIEPRVVQHYQIEAQKRGRPGWYWAYFMDIFEDERKRGKTVEHAVAHFSTEKRDYTLLDAPGHKQYISSMLGCTVQGDVAVLIVSARTGEFEAGINGGQTKEHAILATTVGIKRLIVAVNKMDSVNWAQERFLEITKELMKFLVGIRYKEEDVTFIPISAQHGYNIKEKLPEDQNTCPWYTGPPLLQLLDQQPLPKRNPDGNLRLPVISKYSLAGQVFLLGKIESGTMKVGQQVFISPSNSEQQTMIPLTIDQITISEKYLVKEASHGDHVRIRISLTQGHSGTSDPLKVIPESAVLCDCKPGCPQGRKIQAQILVVQPPKKLLAPGYSCLLHLYHSMIPCSLVSITRTIDPKTRKTLQKNPLFLTKSAAAEVVLEFLGSQDVCLELGLDGGQLSRIVLRDQTGTVAIGRILSIVPLKINK